MGVNTLPPGAPRSSSILGLEQGLRSERVKSLNRRDRVFSRASRSPRTGWAFPEGFRRAQRCDPDLGCPVLVHLPQGLRPPHLARRDLGADAHGSRINVVPEFC